AVGGDCLSSELEIHCGGVGVNTSLALARLQVLVRLLGATGRDWFGEFALRGLQAERVDVSFVQRRQDAVTGMVFIAVNPDGQRTIFGSRGANEMASLPPDTRGCWEGIEGLHLVGYSFLSPFGEKSARRLLEEARRFGAWVSLDVGDAPSRQVPRAILQAAREVDILIAACDEAAALTGQRDAQSAFTALEESGARRVVVKLGGEGCLFREDGALRNAPGFPVQATDTTGAGDVFTATLLRARLREWPWPEGAIVANAAGGLAATVVGAGESIPAAAGILELLQTSRLPGEWDAVRRRALERLTRELRVTDSAASR
ncbi:MAG: carbohydrate kinase family protein, partial [Candidatus Acidiferrales bacterium]